MTADRFGFSRVAVATLPVHLARPADNAAATVALAEEADDDGVDLVVFPEPGLTRYSIDDLFHRGWRCSSRRFFKTSQFKRSAMPDGPKIGSGSLSPRGDWRALSDSSAAAWLADLTGD